MPKKIALLRVVLASPNDVRAERNAVESAIHSVNRDTAHAAGIHLELSRWETDATPGFHPQGPQGLIDPVLKIEDCDLLIGVFARRFGTPMSDGKTGTEHEIDLAYRSWLGSRRPQIMLYFNTKPYRPQTDEEAEQYRRVQAFRENFPKEGLWWEYKSRPQFAKLLESHLRSFVHEQAQAMDEGSNGEREARRVNVSVSRRMLESLEREMDALGASRQSKDPFDDQIIFNRIIQGIMVWAHHILEPAERLISGSNIMFLRRRNDPFPRWCFRLHESDLFFNNWSLVLKMAFCQGRDYYLGQRRFRDFHVFISEDSPHGRLGLNGRTLQELFLGDGGKLRFPVLDDIEDHVLTYNELLSSSPFLDRKVGYGVRITNNYEFIYAAKEALGYRSYLSERNRQRIRGLINIPIFAQSPETGRIDRVLGVYNIDIARLNAISDDQLEQLIVIQRTFNRAFDIFMRKSAYE